MKKKKKKTDPGKKTKERRKRIETRHKKKVCMCATSHLNYTQFPETRKEKGEVYKNKF